MTTQLIHSGGIQQVFDYSALLSQIIYLDFDGELTSYNGEILTLDHVTVEDSGLTKERIAKIVAALNEQFAGQNVKFVTARPEGEYSAIYVGKTSSFEPYGNFTGLAETVDHGNKKKNDNAFVMLDSTTDDAQIIATIAHEAGHLLGTLDHGGEGLEKYGWVTSLTIEEGQSSSGLDIRMGGGDAQNLFVYGNADSTAIGYSGTVTVCSGGTAAHTNFNHYSGDLYILDGGFVCDTTVTQGYVCLSSGASASGIDIVSATVYVHSGASIQNMHLSSNAYMMVFGSVQMSDLVCDSGAILRLSIAGGTDIHGSYDSNPIEVNNGVISSSLINYNSLEISSGGIASDIEIANGKLLTISSGGTATGFSMGNGDLTMALSPDTQIQGVSGGTAINVSDGRLSGYRVKGGGLLIYSGGYAENIDVMRGNNYGGTMKIYSGGTAKMIRGSGMYTSAIIRRRLC